MIFARSPEALRTKRFRGSGGPKCNTCDVGLGNFKDDLVRILDAADYLEGTA